LPQDASNREIQAVWATAKGVRCGLFITEFTGLAADPGSGEEAAHHARAFLLAVWMMARRIRWLPHAAAATTTIVVAARTRRDFVAFGC
jgi:hypothetical protein